MAPRGAFEWDDAKAERNLRVHGVDFAVALKVFVDPGRIEYIDDSEDYEEERWVAIGYAGGQLLYVVYTMRRDDRVTRLISARPATRREADDYYAHFSR